MSDEYVDYKKYLQSDYWKEYRRWRNDRLLKRGKVPRCEICRSDKRVELHHILYSVGGKSILYHEREYPQYIKRLCRECHELAHKHFKGKVWTRQRGRIMNLLARGVTRDNAFTGVFKSKTYSKLMLKPLLPTYKRFPKKW